jgi:hypothetical protein
MQKIYFKAGVFFREDEHGARTKMVEDPAHVWPKKLVPDPEWTPPSEPHEPGTPPPQAPMVEVDDYSAGAPMVEADNPACTVPPDALEIPYDDYIACLDGLLVGKTVSTGPDGLPQMVDPPPPDVEAEEVKTRVMQARYFLAFTDWLSTLGTLENYHTPPAIEQARARAAEYIATHAGPV